MLKSLIPLVAIFLIISCNNPGSEKNNFATIALKYPETKKDTTIRDTYFGTVVADPYRWLENDTSSETGNWVIEQNKVTQSYLQQIPFRDAIRKRSEHLYNYEKFTTPVKEGKFYYYYKNSGLQNQSVMYREPIEGGAAEVFIDPNTFSKDGTTSIGGITFSHDGSMAAYNISEGGSDWQKIIVIDALTKKQVGDTMKDIKFSGASWKNNQGFYYSTYDRPKEGSFLAGKTDDHKLYYHQLGTPQKEDKLIFGGKGEKIRYVGAELSENQHWLIISCSNSTYGNNLFLLDLTNPKATFIPIVTDQNNSHTVVD
ncbi:MAG: S9 family peptidase, partial [Bacteroidota bacterium]